MATWDEFCEAVLTTSYRRTTTEQALDAFETRIGVPLPICYREFTLTFGAGRLVSPEGSGIPWVEISTPGRHPRPLWHHLDTVVWNEDVLKEATAGAAARGLQGLVIFAKDESGRSFGWKLDEVTCPETRDYAVYLERAGSEAGERVASTFEEFLVDYCVGKPLSAWLAAGGRLDRDVPAEEAWDETSRIRFHPNFTVSDFDNTPDEDEDEDEEEDEDDEGRELVEVVHRMAAPPDQFGEGDDTLFWEECLPDGKVKVMFWTPRGKADRARMEQFLEACQEIDWDGEEIHEVVATEFKSSQTIPPDIALAQALAAPVPPRVGPPPEFTEQGLVRRVPHPAAPVAESWRRIEAWLAAHCPEVFVALLPGASDRDIDRFEQAIGQKLPEDVKASYKIHDGLGAIPREYEEMIQGGDDDDDIDEDDVDDIDAPEPNFIRSLFYGYGLDAIGADSLCEKILRNWESWTEFADEEHEESHQAHEFEVFPAGAIKLRYSCRGWIPLYNSCSNCLGVDLDPGPNGIRGQVINFGRDEGRRYVLATSWAQFLEDFADELEAGNYDIEDREDCDRRLQMKRPKLGSIYCNYQSWSQAKLDPAFQSAQPAPEPELSPSDPATDRECRAVVSGFIAEHHAWEVRWLAVRPVKELGFVSIGENPDGRFVGRFNAPADLVAQGRPVPDSLVFANSKAFSDTVKQARWLESTLKFGRCYDTAMAERRAIYAKYTTAWAQNQQGATFWLRRGPTCDPQVHRPVEVLRRDASTVLVVLAPRSGLTERFLLRRESGAWRIEILQESYEGGPFMTQVSLCPALDSSGDGSPNTIAL